jgi:hypothetical protein
LIRIIKSVLARSALRKFFILIIIGSEMICTMANTFITPEVTRDLS